MGSPRLHEQTVSDSMTRPLTQIRLKDNLERVAGKIEFADLNSVPCVGAIEWAQID